MHLPKILAAPVFLNPLRGLEAGARHCGEHKCEDRTHATNTGFLSTAISLQNARGTVSNNLTWLHQFQDTRYGYVLRLTRVPAGLPNLLNNDRKKVPYVGGW